MAKTLINGSLLLIICLFPYLQVTNHIFALFLQRVLQFTVPCATLHVSLKHKAIYTLYHSGSRVHFHTLIPFYRLLGGWVLLCFVCFWGVSFRICATIGEHEKDVIKSLTLEVPNRKTPPQCFHMTLQPKSLF